MLRFIFTLMSTGALLMVGGVWLAAQPSGGEVREVVRPVLERGAALASQVARRAASVLGADAVPASDVAGAADSGVLALTPTATGIWEPEAEALPAAPRRELSPPLAAGRRPALPPPAPDRIAAEDPDRVEEVALLPPAPFVPGPLAVGVGPAVAGDAAGSSSSAAPNQDDWAALIRRMLAVHGRVSGAE